MAIVTSTRVLQIKHYLKNNLKYNGPRGTVGTKSTQLRTTGTRVPWYGYVPIGTRVPWYCNTSWYRRHSNAYHGNHGTRVPLVRTRVRTRVRTKRTS